MVRKDIPCRTGRVWLLAQSIFLVPDLIKSLLELCSLRGQQGHMNREGKDGFLQSCPSDTQQKTVRLNS